MIGTQLVPMEQDEISSFLQRDIIDINVVENGILIASITLGPIYTPSVNSKRIKIPLTCGNFHFLDLNNPSMCIFSVSP